MNRRLCMVVHGPYPVGEPRVSREAGAALEAGWQVDVVAMRRAGEPAREDVAGADVRRLPLAHRRGAGMAALAAEYVGFTLAASATVARRSLRAPFDVVHVHNPPDTLILAALVPRLRGAGVIFDVHDLTPDMFAMRFDGVRGGRVVDLALRTAERAAIALSDAVVTVHEPYRSALLARGASPDTTTVIMNAVDETLLPRPALRHDGTFRVVYHGTVTPPYGVEVLVEAIARAVPRVPSIRLDVLGEGDAVDRVRARAAELGIADRVTVSGRYLPHREVLAAVASASVGVVPNLDVGRLSRYALSTKLFEYVALGVPVVSSSLPTLAAHFAEHEVRFFAPGDPAALADALADVASDPAAARARAVAATARYEQYRWARQAERYLSVLERAARARSARPRLG